MAQKKVYFYAVHLYNGDNEKKYSSIKDILVEIIDQYSKDKSGYKTLDITPFDQVMHSVFDIFEYENNHMFGRLSKQHPSNSYLSRDYTTYDGNEIFPANENNSGIENYTFAYMDYSIGVLGIVSAMGAPGEKAFVELFEKYSKQYSIKLVSIPNENAIREIYDGQRPDIAKLEIEVPLPSAEVLRNIFGWRENEVIDSFEKDSLVASVIVKSERRGGKIVRGSKSTRTLMDAVNSIRDKCRKAKMKAESESVKMQEFNLFDNKFSYPIDIVNYHILDGERVYYSINEMVEHYKQNLSQSFNANFRMLTRITNRERIGIKGCDS